MQQKYKYLYCSSIEYNSLSNVKFDLLYDIANMFSNNVFSKLLKTSYFIPLGDVISYKNSLEFNEF